jgi:hypothetical protein
MVASTDAAIRHLIGQFSVRVQLSITGKLPRTRTVCRSRRRPYRAPCGLQETKGGFQVRSGVGE